jgi:Ca-activated chloride channel family protein
VTAVALALLAPLVAAAQEAVFSAEVRLVRLAATVRDSAGALVSGVPKESFRIVDSGVPQDIAVFEKSSAQPLSIAVLVDSSGSTAKELPEQLASIRTFFKELFGGGNPGDTASLYSFNHDVLQLVPYSRRLSRLDQSLKRIVSEAGTSLYDAIHFAGADLQSREGRRAIIVVTDGGDTTSVYNLQDALKAAQTAEATVYPILVVPIQNDAGRNVGGENALTTIAGRTGGRVYQVSLGPNLSQAFAGILEDLRTQYLLGYYPRGLPPVSNAFREVKVSVTDPAAGRQLRVVTRSGYYEDVRGPSRAGQRLSP